MNPLLAVTFCLLVTLEPVDCQRDGRKLQPWVQGVIAVAVFLVLAVVVFAINRLWCQDKDCLCSDSFEDQNDAFAMTDNKVISNGAEGSYSSTGADYRCQDALHVYENNIELECGNTIEHHCESHIEVLSTCM